MGKWEMVRLGDVCEVVSGSTPSTNNPELWGGDIKWVTPAEISDNSYVIYDTERHISEKAGLKPMPAGTVLLSSRAPIGKVAIADVPMCCNQGFKNLICSAKVHNRFLYRYLKNQIVYLNSLGRGATFKEISKSIVEEVLFPLPTLPIQKKIADVLDRASALIEKRKAQVEKLDLLVKSKFIEMFNGEQYPLVRLEDICGFITKGTTPPVSRITNTITKTSIPYIKVYNLSDNGELHFHEEPQYIDIETHNSLLARSKVFPEDVLMNIVGLPLGKFALVPNDFAEWNINQAVAIFRSMGKVLPIYLMYAMMKPDVLRPFLDKAVGIRQVNLSLKQCRELEIPLPPLELQSCFVDFVHVINKLRLELQQGLSKLELLYKSLMYKYFKEEVLDV